MKLLGKITEVVEDYGAQGFKLTLRQLYYQLVVKEILANKAQNYSKLSRILTDARLCGQVDWDIIEDRIRIPKMHSEWRDIQSLVRSALYTYRKDRMVGQDNYVEVWVEKDALSGVLQPITDEYHVNLMVNRGYSSISAMHDAAIRFKENSDKDPHILYLGDHDPSGLDMNRDIKDRLNMFGVDVELHGIALTKAQIDKYQPPSNPAKWTDPRAKEYVEIHGEVSWELDALTPTVLHALLREELEQLIDLDMVNEIIEQEDDEKEKLRELAENI